MIVSRPLTPKEPDLLIGQKHQTLIFKDIDGAVIRAMLPPKSGWSHDLLERVVNYVCADTWDAYLGTKWIGSSEV